VSTLQRPQSNLAIGSARTRVPSLFLHELRNPLNQIIGYAEMLAEGTEEERRDRFVSDLENIRSAGHRMLALIEENFTSFDDKTFAAAADDDDENQPESVPAEPQPAALPGVLLVVDDDAINRDVLTRRLTRQGHHVQSASNGQGALLLMKETAFDLILLDVVMPEMDGYDVLRRIRADDQLKNVPVIMISVVSQMQSVVRCIEAGAEDYLAKPFNPTLLKARIGACLEKKRGRDRENVLYEQLQENYKRLQEVERLRDDMRNMIVHDLRTPLTAVIVGVDMLQRHGALNEEQTELMTLAAGGGRTLLAMVNDLLDVEKMESGSAQLQRVELSADALVAGALEQVSALAVEGQIELITEIASGLPHFSGDEKKLTRTLVNLIANAIKFTSGGTVTVIASEEKKENIRFAIRDTGVGIPAAAFDRIFEKFGQLDSRRAGTGLGLAFCKLAVEAHGGSIQVESTAGTGSTFSFSIPLAVPQ
jgi:two-component system, sensor histidine kinase and response regulator